MYSIAHSTIILEADIQRFLAKLVPDENGVSYCIYSWSHVLTASNNAHHFTCLHNVSNTLVTVSLSDITVWLYSECN